MRPVGKLRSAAARPGDAATHRAQDPDDARRLWNVSERLTGLTYAFA